jgi:SAM-dependent methyltransferase
MHAALIRSTALALLLAAVGAHAQAPAAAPATPAAEQKPAEFVPESGQAGKDVVWVPTPQVLVDRMLDMAKVTARDYVMDLGSGDGRTVITAAKRGARAMGIEYNPDMVALSQRNAEKEGVSARATFVKADLFETDFSKATVITMFLLPDINVKLRPKILQLRPGTRVVSNSFDMGDWKSDQTVNLTADQGCTASWCTAHLWIVPARVEGTHKLPEGELTLKQTYQMLSGTLQTANGPVQVTGKVLGRNVSLKAGDKEYRGRVKGKTLSLS